MSNFFLRGPDVEHARGFIYQGLKEMYEGGSRNGVLLSEGAQCGGPLGRATLLGNLEDILRKATGTGISFYRGPVGELGGDFFCKTFERKG